MEREDAVIPSFYTPHHFLWLGASLFFAGRGGHFARCTHMLQEGGGGRRAVGKDRRRALHVEPPPHPPEREITKKLPNNTKPRQQTEALVDLAGGFVFQGDSEAEGLKGPLLWAVHVVVGTWWGSDPKPGPPCPCAHTATLTNSWGLHPKACGCWLSLEPGRLPRTVWPGAGAGVLSGSTFGERDKARRRGPRRAGGWQGGWAPRLPSSSPG